MNRPGLLKAVFAVISLMLGLFGVELALRAFAVIGGEAGNDLAKRDPMAVLFEPNGEHGYKQRPNHEQVFGNGAVAHWNALGFRGPLVSLEKPADVYRILLLGGSTTHGFGVEDNETIDAHMREILAQRMPARRFEVVNLALGGYDSYMVLTRMRSDGIRMDPDLVIINSGINDVRNAPHRGIVPGDPRTLLWEANMSRMRHEAIHGPSLKTRLAHHFYLARLPSFLRSRFEIESTVDSWHRVVPQPDALDYFEANIRATAKLVSEVDSDLILATPASAILMQYDPKDVARISYWIVDAGTTQSYRDRLADRMKRIATSLEATGQRVPYLRPEPGADAFIDDCHLNTVGNRFVAGVFVDAVFEVMNAERGGPDPPPAVRDDAM